MSAFVLGRIGLPKSVLRLFCKNILRWRFTLSYNEAATALRPFYFAVHPDLFGQYPVAREVNENSLKRLNEYLLAVKRGQILRPITVPFYLRRHPSIAERNAQHLEDKLTAVKVTLTTESLGDIVSTVLQTCKLPLDHISKYKSTINIQATQAYDPDKNRPIKWNQSFYAAYGMEYPDEKYEKPKSKNLRSWLDRNVTKAKRLQEAHEALSLETDRLRKKVKQSTGLAEIKWASSWGYKQFRTSLMSFQNLYAKYGHQLDLNGHILVFGNEDGVCLNGNIIVKSDEVAETWLPLFRNIASHLVVLKSLQPLEGHLCTLLNNALIIRRTGYPGILATDYEAQLHKLTELLSNYLKTPRILKIREDLHDVEIIIDCAEGPLHINDFGQILIPARCSPFLIIDFLNDNADRARKIRAKNLQNEISLGSVIETTAKCLHLRSLKKDSNITSDEMRQCCTNLIDQFHDLEPFVKDCRIKVSRFYSVMSDGEICIPWDWATLL